MVLEGIEHSVESLVGKKAEDQEIYMPTKIWLTGSVGGEGKKAIDYKSRISLIRKIIRLPKAIATWLWSWM